MFKLPQRQVHLDFHTSEEIDGIGSKFDREQFKACLKKGHVNSITVFAKCHHGWAYFPSEKNVMHPGLKFDLLSEELCACKEANVQAPIYISAGLDEKYAVQHPEHLTLRTKDAKIPTVEEIDGKKCFTDIDMKVGGYHLLCFNTPYLDVLVEQIKEVVQKYETPGIFLDISSPHPCYCEYCNKGIADMGWDINDPVAHENYAEIVYKKYYEATNAAAKSVDPNMRVFHNGGHIPCGRRDIAHANTHLELESLPTGGWGYDHFPKSAKYVHNLGMEYLGMTGKFHTTWGEFGGFKHPNALRYEIALSLANGAKCSIGDQMHPYGFLDDATYELIGNAYGYAESVEEYCYDVTPKADIGLLSREATSNSRNDPEDVGACRMMLEGNYLYDVLDLECDFNKYKLLILPKNVTITGELAKRLDEFVNGGGKLLCTGKSGLNENGGFAYDCGVKFVGASKYNPTYFHPTYNALGLTPSNYVFYGKMYDVQLTDENAKVLGYSRNPFFNREPQHFCSHQHTPFVMENNGIGAVVGKHGGYIAWEIFTDYENKGSIILKDLFVRTVEEILGESKTLKTNLPAQGVVTLNKQDKSSRYVLHMLYASPVKRGKNIDVIEDLVPVHNTEFEINVPEKVKAVKLVPQNTQVEFTQNDGVVKFKVDEFTCSQIAVLEY